MLGLWTGAPASVLLCLSWATCGCRVLMLFLPHERGREHVLVRELPRALAEPLPLTLGVAQLFHDVLLGGLEPVLLQL